MKINFNNNNGILNVALDGRLDTTTAPELENFISNNYDGTGSIVIDCEKLSYISSAGLRVLLAAQKKTKGARKESKPKRTYKHYKQPYTPSLLCRQLVHIPATDTRKNKRVILLLY